MVKIQPSHGWDSSSILDESIFSFLLWWYFLLNELKNMKKIPTLIFYNIIIISITP
jgi:hypothetical protein